MQQKINLTSNLSLVIERPDEMTVEELSSETILINNILKAVEKFNEGFTQITRTASASFTTSSCSMDLTKRSYLKWSDEDIEKLKKWKEKGYSCRDVAKKLGVEYKKVYSKYKSL